MLWYWEFLFNKLIMWNRFVDFGCVKDRLGFCLVLMGIIIWGNMFEEVKKFLFFNRLKILNKSDMIISFF